MDGQKKIAGSSKNANEMLYETTRKRQTLFISHIRRRKAMENMVMSGKMSGRAFRDISGAMMQAGLSWRHGGISSL